MNGADPWKRGSNGGKGFSPRKDAHFHENLGVGRPRRNDEQDQSLDGHVRHIDGLRYFCKLKYVQELGHGGIQNLLYVSYSNGHDFEQEKIYER